MSGPERRGEIDEQYKSPHAFRTGKLRVPSFLEMALLASRIRDKPANFGGGLCRSGGGSRECTPIGKEDG